MHFLQGMTPSQSMSPKHDSMRRKHDLMSHVCMCYRMKGDAGMVFSLEQIQDVENKDLLTGHILVLLGQDYDAAQAS